MENPRRRHTDKIIEAIPGFLTVQDRDYKIVEANGSFVRSFGKYEGRCCYQVYKNSPEKCEDCPVERTFHDGQSHRSEEQVKTLGGRDIWVLVNTTPIFNDDGKVIQVIEMSTDITEMKALQDQLRESQLRYRQLFEEVPCFISIQGPDLRIIDANRMFREAFGNCFGEKCYKIYKHRTEECHPCVIRQTFADGKSRMHEEVVTSQDGKTMNVLVSTSPLFNANGKIESVIEMSTDITQIRQLQSKLASTGLLISSISHGLKGLLNSLDGGFYLVNSGLQKDNQARVKQGWEIAQRNVERIKSMVLDILYYAKDREPDWQPVSSQELMDDVTSIIEGKAKTLKIKFEKTTVDNAPEFEADYKAVRSMLVNLLENSLDACRVDLEKEVHKISFGLKDKGDYIEYQVVDNGIGMDQQTREKAFSLFFSSKGSEGTGLGLFIANKIAQQHGGSIELESQINKGTSFRIKLSKKRVEKEISASGINEVEEDFDI